MKKLNKMNYDELKHTIKNCKELRNYCIEKYIEQEEQLNGVVPKKVDLEVLADLLEGELECDECENMRVEYVLHWD